MKRLIPTLLILTLAACAGRSADPVPVAQNHDLALACVELDEEIAGNGTAIQALVDERNKANIINVGVGAVGFTVFWPALFALDLTVAERAEISALEQRSNRLVQIGSSKGCPQEAFLQVDGETLERAVADMIDDARRRVEPLVPPGYLSYQRAQMDAPDASGRRLSVPVNRFTY